MPAKVTFKRPSFKDQTDVINAATFNSVTAESGEVPDATTGEPGVITLAGDLDGAGAQPKIRESVLSTFWRGITKLYDLAASKIALELDKVDNTTDAEKPVSGPQATAIAAAKGEAVSVANAHADEAARAAELTASQFAEQAATVAGAAAFTAAQNDAKQYALPDRLAATFPVEGDANNCKEAGFFVAINHTPIEGVAYYLIVNKHHYGWVNQIAIKVNDPFFRFFRWYNKDLDQWSSWEREVDNDAPANNSAHARKNNEWQKLGTAALADILSGTAAPVNTQGKDGDLYLQYT